MTVPVLKHVPMTIIGGGIVGKTLALSLCRSGLFIKDNGSLCLVDGQPRRHPPQIEKSSQNAPRRYSNRVSFLAPSSVALYERIFSPQTFTSLFQHIPQSPKSATDPQIDIQDKEQIMDKDCISQCKESNIFEQSIVNRRAWPVHRMHILDGDVRPSLKLHSFLGQFWKSSFDIVPDAKHIGESPLGFLVENDVLETALDSALAPFEATGQLMWLSETMLTAIDDAKESNDSWPSNSRCLTVRSKGTSIDKLKDNLSTSSDKSASSSGMPAENLTSFWTDLVVGADGIHSKVRSILNIPYLERPLSHKAIVATVQTDMGALEKVISSSNSSSLSSPSSITNTNTMVLGHTAIQRFLSTGPLALLPLSPDTFSIVWSLPTVLADRICALEEDSFLDALRIGLSGDITDLLYYVSHPSAKVSDFPSKLFLSCGSRAAFPLAFGIAPCSTAPQTVLIGDAAHRVHPLAGQGLNMGLSDVISLTNVLKSDLAQAYSLGSSTTLDAYSRSRDMANFGMLTAIDLVHHVFTSKVDQKPFTKTLENLKNNHNLESDHNLKSDQNRILNQERNYDFSLFGMDSVGTPPSLGQAVRRFLLPRVMALSPFQRLFQSLAR